MTERLLPIETSRTNAQVQSLLVVLYYNSATFSLQAISFFGRGLLSEAGVVISDDDGDKKEGDNGSKNVDKSETMDTIVLQE